MYHLILICRCVEWPRWGACVCVVRRRLGSSRSLVPRPWRAVYIPCACRFDIDLQRGYVGVGVRSGCVLSSCVFSFCRQHIMAGDRVQVIKPQVLMYFYRRFHHVCPPRRLPLSPWPNRRWSPLRFLSGLLQAVVPLWNSRR